MQLNPYLLFAGTCEEAFKFYEKVLGGAILAMMAAKGSPMEAHCPPDRLDKIMHARMRVGETILMGSDVPDDQFQKPQGFSVTLTIATPEEAERVFHAFSEGGSVQMPIQETFWAQRFGMFTDRYGTPWMINCEKPM